MVRSKLISEGSSGCIFRPNLKCKTKKNKKTTKKSKNKKSKQSNKITKLMFKETNIEYNFIKIIKRIEGYKEWTILWEYKCESQPYKELLKNSDINKCFENINTEINQNKRYTLLQGEYGGQTAEKYCKRNITLSHLTNRDKFIKYFIKYFKLLEGVFYGLTQLEKHNICHHDINIRNILFKKNKSYIIDYDISLIVNKKLTKNSFLKKRMINETIIEDRIYEAYPIEYIYYPLKKPEILKEKKGIKSYQSLVNYYEYYDPIFHHIFNINTNQLRHGLLDRKLKRTEQDLTGLIQKLDIYSLGMAILIPFFDAASLLMISQEDIIKHFKSRPLAPYMDLIKRILAFNHKDRISSQEAYEIYLNLIS